jgi:hypothetical protein
LGIVIDSSVSSSVKTIGDIHEDFFLNLDSWTQTKPNATFVLEDNGGVTLSGGNGTFANKLNFTDPDNAHRLTQLPVWGQYIDVVPNVVDVSSFGLSIGMDSTDPNGNNFSVMCRFAMDTGAFSGKLQFYTLVGGAAGFTSRHTSVKGFVVDTEVEYRFVVLRIYNTLVAYILQGGAIKNMDSYTFPLLNVSNNRVMHNISHPTLWLNGGDMTVNKYKFWSDAQKGVDFLFMGDSNLNHQWCGNSYQNGYMEQIQNLSTKTFLLWAGSGETVVNAYNARAEILALSPKTVYMNYLSNDRFEAIDYTTEYNALIADLENNGITVLLGTPIARTGVDLTAEVAFVKAKTNKVFDLHALTLDMGTTLRDDINAGDNIHINPQGHSEIASKLISEHPAFLM